jgi:hypothetical protein
MTEELLKVEVLEGEKLAHFIGEKATDFSGLKETTPPESSGNSKEGGKDRDESADIGHTVNKTG